MGTTPQPAGLALNVGVTGHRLQDLKEADKDLLREKVREVLEEIRRTVNVIYGESGSAFNGEPLILRIISPLADGADRIVAEEAINLGFELQCPLPFSRQEYARDFASEESRHEYTLLLDKATAVLELDGSRERPGQSYLAAGQIVLDQSDILIAIWDGQEAKGEGGTGQIIELAQSNYMPVVWIHSEKPHDIRFIAPESNMQTWHHLLNDRLTKVLNPSYSDKEHTSDKVKSDLRGEYFLEKQRRWNAGFYFKVFRDVLAKGKPGRPRLRQADYMASTSNEWKSLWQVLPEMPHAIAEQINGAFCNHYAWADKLADYYANLYRSSFLINYLLGGLAVFLALLGFALGLNNENHHLYHYQWIPVAAELFVITLIINATIYGNYRRWHERWIDYRLLAEQLRTMRFMAPLGRVAPSVRIPAHHSHADSQSSWIDWHFRAIVRDAGLINARMDTTYLENYRTLLMEQEVKSQIDYHNNSAKSFHKITHRLHKTGLVLFLATLVACVAHLIYHGEYSDWLTLLSAVLPAFGAAFAGILFQGEFQRLSERSAAMSSRLQNIYDELNSLKTLSSQELGQIADDVANIMVTEVLDWRIVLQARPLTLPS